MSPFISFIVGCGGSWIFDLDLDEDGDGYKTGKGGDCYDNPTAPLTDNQGHTIKADDINPGKDEILADGIDENCNGMDDEDVDGDGVTAADDDCDDSSNAVFPSWDGNLIGALEIIDGVDNNCNGQTDEAVYLSSLVTFLGLQPNDFFGSSTTGGDVNGDGLSDIAFGATEAAGQTAESGNGYLFTGREVWKKSYVSSDANSLVEGSLANQRVATTQIFCDVNNDGFADWVVGAVGYDGANTNDGGVGLFWGAENFADGNFNQANILWSGSALNAALGFAIACGDLNKDGFGDLSLGAPGLNGSQGAVFLIAGSEAPSGGSADQQSFLSLYGKSDNDRFGAALAGGFDINGDGFADLIVGAPGRSTSAGSAYIYLGGVGMLDNPVAELKGEAAYDQAGNSVALIDVNGDGYADIIVGASLNDNGGSEAGSVYVNFGGVNLNDNNLSSSSLVIRGTVAGAQFGQSVATIGDFDADGRGDLAIASLSDFNGEDAGRIYLYFGKTLSGATALDDTQEDGLLIGDAGSHALVLGSAGNVNGSVYPTTPGFPDFLVGAPSMLDGMGQGYLVFGQGGGK